MPGKHKVKLIILPPSCSSAVPVALSGREISFLRHCVESTWSSSLRFKGRAALTVQPATCTQSAITASRLNDLGCDSPYCKHAEPLWSQDAPLSRLSSRICLHHRQTVRGGRLFLWRRFLFGTSLLLFCLFVCFFLGGAAK